MPPSCSSRSGWATRWWPSRTSVTFPRRPSAYPRSRATGCPRASVRPRSTPPCASSPSAGEAIYALDEERLRELEPDLIVTQELCPVCAVSYDEVVEVAGTIPSCPKVVALDPRTLGESFADLRTIAHATGARDAALDLVARQRARVDAVRLAVRAAPRRAGRGARVARPGLRRRPLGPADRRARGRPRRARLRGRALGALDVGGRRRRATARSSCACRAATTGRGRRSRPWASPTSCGALGARRVVAVDASAYFSRPGPRLVDGLELLAHVLHPERHPDAPAVALDVPLV